MIDCEKLHDSEIFDYMPFCFKNIKTFNNKIIK